MTAHGWTVQEAVEQFEQNIRGHAFNALTASLGSDPWLPLSRRKEIADAIGDAILAFLAPLGLNDAAWQPEAREIPLRRCEPEEVLARIAASDLSPDLKALMAEAAMLTQQSELLNEMERQQ